MDCRDKRPFVLVMFTSVVRWLSLLLAVFVVQSAAACTGNRNLALCAKSITPFVSNAAKFGAECGVIAPASGVEMLMAESIQMNNDGTW